MKNTNEKAQSASIKDKIYDGVVKHAAKHGSVSCRSISLISMSKYSEHLERKVSELEQDLAKSQEKCSKYEGALGLGESWPITDVMQKLVESTEYLLDVKNYDRTGWEEVSHCTKLGRQYVGKINDVLAEQALKPKEDGN